MAKRGTPTPKQAKALELIREGVNPVRAMREAGYSEDTSRHPANNLLRAPGAQTIIEQYKDAYSRVGITPEYMARKTAEWLEAKKIKTSVTEPDQIVPDYDVQLKAAEMVRRDWDMLKEDGKGPNVGVAVVITRGEDHG